MTRALIVEDEQPAAERLQELLSKMSGVEIVATCASGEEAVRQIEELKPDLVFLDIHLTDISGLDVLRFISHRPAVIFTTAFDQYAVEAFQIGAVDYLLKPFSEERLRQAVGRVTERLSESARPSWDVQALLSHWQAKEPTLRRIPSKVGDKIYILSVDDIVYFATHDKLVFAHLKDTRFLINYTLEDLEQRLDAEKFFRIHRSTIVNLDYVKTIEAWFGGGYKMTVRDKQNSTLMISRSAGKKLRRKLGW